MTFKDYKIRVWRRDFQLYYSNYINFLYKFFKSSLCLC